MEFFFKNSSPKTAYCRKPFWFLSWQFHITCDNFLHFTELKDKIVNFIYFFTGFHKKGGYILKLSLQHMGWFTYFMLCLSIMIPLSECTQFIGAALWKLSSVCSSVSAFLFRCKEREIGRKKFKKMRQQGGYYSPIHA